MLISVILCVMFLIYSIVSKDGFIHDFKEIDTHNADIQYKIDHGFTNWDTFSCRKYDKRDTTNPFKLVMEYVFINVTVWALICFAVFIVSLIASCIYRPMVDYDYSFKINSLKDNLVTEGEFHGSMFAMSGYIDGELSYFYSREYSNGTKIGHIPASDTYIQYNNDEHPKVTVYKEKSDYPEWFKKVFFDFEYDTLKYYVITVPEGSIVTNGMYQIDME